MGKLVWKKHLNEYRSDKGYVVVRPPRGSYYTLLFHGDVRGRYPRLSDAKEAAEKAEVSLRRQELGVLFTGHERFEGIWGVFDVTVANRLAEEHGELSSIDVATCANWIGGTKQRPDGTTVITVGVTIDEAHVSEVDISVPVTVATMVGRDGAEKSMVIDGWHRIAKAHREGVKELPCRILSLEDTELVRL